MTDHVSPSKRSEIMSLVKSKATKPELAIRKTIHSLGYRFRLHDSSLPGKPDIVLKARKKAIFVHGCFWHRHSKCKYSTVPKTKTSFWKEKFRKNVRRDKIALNKLGEMGWNTLVVWQCELKNPELLSSKLLDFLNDGDDKKKKRKLEN